jgi:hypothetical protein
MRKMVGRAEEGGNFFFLDDFEGLLRVELPVDDEPPAHVEQGQGQQVPAPRVEEGKQQQGAVLVVQVPGADLVEAVEQLAPVGDQAALGKAGGSPGVDDHVDVLDVQVVAADKGIVAVVQDGGIGKVVLRVFLRREDDELLYGAAGFQVRYFVGEGLLVEKDLRRFVVHELHKFADREAGVVGDEDGAQLARGEVGVDHLDAVPGDKGHPVALAHAGLLAEKPGQEVRPALQVAVGVMRLRVEVVDGLPGAVDPSPEERVVSYPACRHFHAPPTAA